MWTTSDGGSGASGDGAAATTGAMDRDSKSMLVLAVGAAAGAYVVSLLRRQGVEIDALARRLHAVETQLGKQTADAARFNRAFDRERSSTAPLPPSPGPATPRVLEAVPVPPSEAASEPGSLEAPSEHLYMDPSLLRPRRSRAGSEASSQAGGFATDPEGDVGVVVPGTPAPSDRWAMISRRLEMVERSVMQARVSDSGGGKKWKADRKTHANRRKGRGSAEESLEPTHAAGVVAERMDGALPRIDEGDVHEMQKEISKRWQSAPRPRGGAPRPANRRRGVVARRKKGGRRKKEFRPGAVEASER